MKTILRIGTTLLACGLVACTSSESSTNEKKDTAPPAPTGLGTLCPLPSQLINDFTYTSSLDSGAPDARFGGGGKLSGGGFVSPTTLNQDLTQGNWHISGTVNTYSSFGLYFDNCDRIDASKFKGITFKLSGTATGGVTLNVGTVGDTPTPAWMTANGKTTAKPTDAGRCVPTQNTNNQYYSPGCVSPSKNITVPTTPTTISVTWAELTGGTPEASPTPTEITAMSWAFYWAESGVAPYPVDVTLDDLGFIE